MENQENSDIESINTFTEMTTEDDQAGIWGRFTSVEYDYAGLMNVIFLVGIFLVAKYIFKSFILSDKRRGKKTADNVAYAISSFAFFVSLALILTSVGYGDVTSTWFEGAVKTLTYAGLAIVLLIITGLIFDKITLHQFSLNKQIAEGNIAAGIADAGNFISAALIISSSLRWQEFKQADAIIAILGIYIASQILLILSTYIRIMLFNDKKKSIYFHDQIKQNNVAVAIDFAGRRVGTALAITAATNLLSYQNSITLSEVLAEWLSVAVILLLALNILSWITSKIVYWGKDIYQDTLKRNVSSALGDVAIYVSFGIILANCLY